MRTLVVALFSLLPAIASAQSFGTSASGAGYWDFSIGAIYQDSLSVGGKGGTQTATPDTSSLSVDSELGFGLNFSYNFSNHFALGLDIDYINPDYKATIVSEDPQDPAVIIDHELTQWNFRLKGTWNFTDGPLVPFVDFGYAWTNVDSNVADGPPITGCWWHPWWGYICENFYTTFSSTETSWGGGVGLRYDLRGQSYLKLSWNRWELDSGGNSDDLTLESARLEYGWRF
ncbi:MAG: outer membrane beta-barrel protein [Woeseiaceae bacterium]|nr:outer membrane beta-barrel protein [Woeseiaceae bacterium]